MFSKGDDGEGRVELAAKEEDESPLHDSHARMHGASCTRRKNETVEWVMLGAGDGKWRVLRTEGSNKAGHK